MTHPGTIFLANGIRTHGENNIDRLLRPLEDLGHRVVDLYYKKVYSWHVYSRTKQLKIAHALKNQILPHPQPWYIAAHSFGCLLSRRLMQINVTFTSAHLFGAADDDETYYPREQAERIHVYYNQKDRALLFGSLLFRHDFGPLGRVGYNGPDDSRIVGLRRDFMYNRPWSTDHNWFTEPMLSRWVDLIHKDCQ